MGTSLSTISQNVANNDKSIIDNYKNLSFIKDTTMRQHHMNIKDQIKEHKDQVCDSYRVFDNKFFTPPGDLSPRWNNLQKLGVSPNRLGLVDNSIDVKTGSICDTIYNYIGMRLELLDNIDISINKLAYCTLSKQAREKLNNIHTTYYSTEIIEDKYDYGFDFISIIRIYIQKKEENELFKLKHKGEKDIKLPYDEKAMNKIESLLKNLYSEQKKYVDKIKEIYDKLHSKYYVSSEELIQLSNSFNQISKSLENNCEDTLNKLYQFSIYVVGNEPLYIEGQDQSLTDKAINFFKKKIQRK